MAGVSRALVRNWRLKLSALGLSVFLWALVQTEPTNPELLPSVPVRVSIADTGWTISGAPAPPSVELELAGPAREIIRLAREGTSVRVPISAVGSRDTTITLRREWVELGQRSGLSIESVSPAFVRLRFEPARTRLVPLAPRLVGDVGDRLALAADIEVSPRLVRVRGPESRLEGLDSLTLLPFDLSNVTRSGAFTIAVDTTGLLGASVVPPLATLGVRVEEVVERVFELDVEANPGPDQEELITEPSRVEVTLRGARSRVTALDPSRLSASVPREDLLGMAPGEARVVPLRLEGVPELVTGSLAVDRIRVRRAIDQAAGVGVGS